MNTFSFENYEKAREKAKQLSNDRIEHKQGHTIIRKDYAVVMDILCKDYVVKGIDLTFPRVEDGKYFVVCEFTDGEVYVEMNSSVRTALQEWVCEERRIGS